MASPVIRWLVGSLGGNARGDADEAHRFLDTIHVKVRMAELLAGRSMAGRSDFIEHEGRRRPHRRPGEGKADPERAVRALVLAELETGEKSRKHLDVATEKLGANPRHPLQLRLLPLENAGQIKPPQGRPRWWLALASDP